jgi:hypothetical protein
MVCGMSQNPNAEANEPVEADVAASTISEHRFVVPQVRELPRLGTLSDSAVRPPTRR